MDSMSLSAFLEQASKLGQDRAYDEQEALINKYHDALLHSASLRDWKPLVDQVAKDPCMLMVTAVLAGIAHAAPSGSLNRDLIVAVVEQLVLFQADPAQLVRRPIPMSYLRNLVHAYVGYMRADNLSIKRGMRTLSSGIARLTPSAHLSCFHSGFVQLCLVAQNPYAALSLLETPVYEIDPNTTGVKAVDFMAYFYYGGVAFLALGQKKRAREFFVNVFSVPGRGVSLVMDLAHKALILLDGFEEYQEFSFPTHMDKQDIHLLKQSAQPYFDFMATLISGNASQLHSAFEKGYRDFEHDDLLGLVDQVHAAAPRRAILSLTRVYVALSLDQISIMVKMPVDRVERMVGSMIAQGEIIATIDSSTGIVTFGQEVQPSLAELQQLIARADDVLQNFRAADDAVISSHPYLMAKLKSLPNLREVLAEFEQMKAAKTSEVPQPPAAVHP